MKIVNNFLKIIALALLLSSCAEFRPIKPAILKPEKPKESAKPAPISPAPSATQKIIKKKYKVGIIVPLSGKNKDLGQSLLDSAMLSIFENDKDNNIELTIFDDKGTTNGALEAIKDAAKQNIKVIIGPVFSTSVEAIADTAKSNKMVVLSFSNNQDLANKKGIFLMGFLPEQQIDKIVSYSISRGRDSFSIITPNNQYGLKIANILKEIVKRRDGNFITGEYYSNTGKELEKAVERTINAFTVSERFHESKKHKSSNEAFREEDKIYSNVIMVPESGETLSKIASLIKKYNTSERDIQLIGSSSWDDISTLNNPDLVGSWFPAVDFTGYKEFEKKYYKTYGKFPVRIGSISYDAISAILELITKSEKRELTSENFINYSGAKNGFSGIDGLFRFLPNSLVQRNLAVLQVGNGKFEVIDSPSRIFLKY